MLPSGTAYKPEVILPIPLFFHSTITQFTPQSLTCTTILLAVLKIHSLPMSFAINIVVLYPTIPHLIIFKSEVVTTLCFTHSMKNTLLVPRESDQTRIYYLPLHQHFPLCHFWWAIWFLNFPHPITHRAQKINQSKLLTLGGPKPNPSDVSLVERFSQWIHYTLAPNHIL